MDLNSEETTRLANDFMASVGIPSPSSGKGVVQNVGDGITTFIDAAKEKGVLTKQDVSKDSSRNGFKLDGGELLKFGFGVGLNSESIEYSGGQYYDGNGWKDWEGC